jgi:hypothetical protein
MTNEVFPLLSGEFAVVLNCLDGYSKSSDPQSKWTIVRFASEQDAERWARDAKAGNEGLEPREIIRGKEFDEFWQAIECLAYEIDGEHDWWERIRQFIEDTPIPAHGLGITFEDFRRGAVRHLLMAC